jgi:hypothetical protein
MRDPIIARAQIRPSTEHARNEKKKKPTNRGFLTKRPNSLGFSSIPDRSRTHPENPEKNRHRLSKRRKKRRTFPLI